MADSLILMVLALVVFGPRRLPQIGRQIGKLMYEFRKASNDFKFQMEEELRLAEDADRRKKEEAERARNLALNPPAQTPAPSVEAQAAIGADDQASVSAQPPAVAAESTYPAEYPAETAAAPTPDDLPQIRYPRINPPSTGELVAAAKPGASVPAETTAESTVAPEASNGTGPAEPAAGSPLPSAEPAVEPTGTEPVSQHG